MGQIARNLDLDSHIFECWWNAYTPRIAMGSVKLSFGIEVSFEDIRRRYAAISARQFGTASARVVARTRLHR